MTIPQATEQPGPRADRRRALRLLPAPSTDPPYDDEVGAAPAVTEGSLALAFPVPTSPLPLRLVPPALQEDIDERITPRSLLPDPTPLTRRLAQAFVEVLVGDRPAAQLTRYASLEVLDLLERTVRRTPRTAVPTARRPTARGIASAPETRPLVMSVHVSEPADGVAEACAVVSMGQRRRALALRLEGLDGRWQCTALQVG
jgi:hypothetical protein